jgi:hypothetical protein
VPAASNTKRFFSKGVGVVMGNRVGRDVSLFQ